MAVEKQSWYLIYIETGIESGLKDQEQKMKDASSID